MFLRTRKRQVLALMCAFLSFYMYLAKKNDKWNFELLSTKHRANSMSRSLSIRQQKLTKKFYLVGNSESSSFSDPSIQNGSYPKIALNFGPDSETDNIGDEDEYEDEIDNAIPSDGDMFNFIADYEDDGAHSSGISNKKLAANSSQIVHERLKDTVSANHSKEDVKWYKAIQGRYSERLKRVQEACEKYQNPGYIQHYTKRHLLYYSYRYDLMVCLSAKVGSSTWKNHLLHMKGINPVTKNIHRNYWEKQIQARNILGHNLEGRLKTSTKVVTVRHPLERLVSAFRDKFCDGALVNKPQSSGHFRYFWRPAYRALHKKRGPDRKLQITFNEFLRYVIIDQRTSGVGDRHWSRLFRSCSICSFRYEYIMKLETYTEDLACLTYLFNITDLNVLNRRHAIGGSESSGEFSANRTKERSIRQSTLQYYDNVPARILSNIFRIYKIDFEMFDYEIPEALKNKVDKTSIT